VNFRLARSSRRRWSGWLIASLLFLQLASAAYACSMPSASVASLMMADLPCAQTMAPGVVPALDPEQPGLCLEHCKGGSQTVDQTPAASAFAPAPVALFVVAIQPEGLTASSAWQAQQRRRERAPPPTHSILHCCYRL